MRGYAWVSTSSSSGPAFTRPAGWGTQPPQRHSSHNCPSPTPTSNICHAATLRSVTKANFC